MCSHKENPLKVIVHSPCHFRPGCDELNDDKPNEEMHLRKYDANSPLYWREY